ncbi:MAG: hypothetical protein IKM97_01410 [Clostridia bacterium]|nr:hypothetical protein [Clostridia bacterium]
MLNQIREKSFLSETTSEITTRMQTDTKQNIDTNKLSFMINIDADRKKNKALLNAKVNYSSNDLLSLKILNTEEAIGIASDDVLDKYISSNKAELNNSIKRITGQDLNLSADFIDESLDNISNNKVIIDEEFKSNKIAEYYKAIFDLIPNEAISVKENIGVSMDSETINTDSYTLNLDKGLLESVYNTFLQKLKNDDELLNKIVTGKETKNQEKYETNLEDNSETLQVNPIQNIQTDMELVEGEVLQHETELEIKSMPQTDLVDETSLDTTNIPKLDLEIEDEKDILNNKNLFLDLIKVFLLDIKIEGTVDDLKSRINEELLNNNFTSKDEIKITIYVRNEEGKSKETLKVVANLLEEKNIDIEYIGTSKFKITYLAPEKNEEGKNIVAGNSLEIEKKSSDVNIKYVLQYCNIENKKVKSKTQIELQTNNANTSKGYTNTANIKYNNNEEYLMINLKNEIKFQENTIQEDFTEENSIFLDKLSNEEIENLFLEVYDKIIETYNSKRSSLNLIDNNSSNSVIQQPVVQPENTAEKEEIKNKLIETVSIMMGEAIQNGEEFTIKNLENLVIDGYDVSTVVSSDLAIIKINGYTFNIDKDFMLSE